MNLLIYKGVHIASRIGNSDLGYIIFAYFEEGLYHFKK